MQLPPALRRILVALTLGLSAGHLRAAETAAPTLEALIELAKEPAEMPGAKLSATLRADDQAAQKLREAGLKFLAAHPQGEERAQVIGLLGNRMPEFIKEFKPGFDERPAPELVVRDTVALAAWQTELVRLIREVARDSTVLPETRLGAAIAGLVYDINGAKTLTDFDSLRAKIDALPKDGASAQQVAAVMGMLLEAAAALAVPDYEKLLKAVAAGSNDAGREAAREALATLVKQKAAIRQVKFTAADGREVDVNALKGKVVLIDFWATWCGPCVREIPNVVAAYEKYHAQGFEIIGISFENPGIIDEQARQRVRPPALPPPVDTPAQIAEKMAKAKKKMLDFAAARGMKWPQHFDGKYWQNEFGQRFEIHSIPAMFLLDKEGNIHSTNARGEALEPAVKKLLGVN